MLNQSTPQQAPFVSFIRRHGDTLAAALTFFALFLLLTNWQRFTDWAQFLPYFLLLAIILFSASIVFIVHLLRQLNAAEKQTTEATIALAEHAQNEQRLQNALSMAQEEASELANQHELLQKLLTLARATSSTSTVKQTLKTTLYNASLLTEAELGSLVLLDAAGRVVESFSSARGRTAKEVATQVGRVMDKGLAGWVARTAETALIHDTSQDERWISFPNDPYQAGSVLGVPILNGSTVVGILTLLHSQTNHFDITDLKLMQSAADQMAQALSNAQIFEGQRRILEMQTTVYEMLHAISRHLNPRSVSQTVVQTVVQLTGWPVAALLIPEESLTEVRVRASAGDFALKRGRNFTLDAETPLGRAFATYTTQRINDVQQDSQLSTIHPHLGSAIVIPLRRGERIMGLLIFGHEETDAFKMEDVLLAEAMGEATALALANAESHTELEKQAEKLQLLYNAVSEERGRLEAVLENSQSGIILVGMDQHVLIINNTAIELLGLSGAPRDWEQRHIVELANYIEDYAPAVAASINNLRQQANEGDRDHFEAEYELGNATVSWSNVSIKVDDQPIGRLHIMRDVTEERLLEQMREDLTSTMVHDLRNPLHMITSGLSLLQAVLTEDYGITDEMDEGKMLSISMANANKMLELINAILDISQLESRRMPLNYRLFNVANLLQDVLETQQPLAQEKQISLMANAGTAGLFAWADRELIERVLSNLVGNALKFSPPNSEITVCAMAVPQSNHIRVEVSDQGHGVPAAIRGRLFEKFTRGDQKGRGSGLGLAFSKMVLEAHHQKIWLVNSSDKGTTFALTLPLPPAD